MESIIHFAGWLRGKAQQCQLLRYLITVQSQVIHLVQKGFRSSGNFGSLALAAGRFFPKRANADSLDLRQGSYTLLDLIHVQWHHMNRAAVQHNLNDMFPKLVEGQHHKGIKIEMVAIVIRPRLDGDIDLR